MSPRPNQTGRQKNFAEGGLATFGDVRFFASGGPAFGCRP